MPPLEGQRAARTRRHGGRRLFLRELQAAALSGGARDVAHDTIGRVITDDIRRVIGSNMQLEPRHIFTNTLPPRAGLNEHDPNRPARRVRLGIIPDALLRNVFLPTTTHSNVPLDVLVDFKTIVLDYVQLQIEYNQKVEEMWKELMPTLNAIDDNTSPNQTTFNIPPPSCFIRLEHTMCPTSASNIAD